MCIFFIFSLWSHGIAFIHPRLVCTYAYGYFMCIFFIFSLWSHGITFIHSRLVCNFAYGYFMCIYLFVFSVATWNNHFFRFNTHSRLVCILLLMNISCVYILFVFLFAKRNNHFFRFNTHSRLVCILLLMNISCVYIYLFFQLPHGITSFLDSILIHGWYRFLIFMVISDKFLKYYLCCTQLFV